LKIDQTGRRAQATRPTFLNHFPKENTAILNSPFSILHSFHGAINQNLQFWLPGRNMGKPLVFSSFFRFPVKT